MDWNLVCVAFYVLIGFQDSCGCVWIEIGIELVQ